MQKSILKFGLFSLLLISGCASETNLQPTIPVNQTVTDNNNQQNQANANSIFQPERKIIKIVNDIFNDYDHNKNGEIDYRSTATSYNDYYKSNENNRYGTTTTQINGGMPYIRVYTRNSLFVASDVDNNGHVTQQEVIDFIKKKYDTNDDDILSSRGIAFWQEKDEYQLFNGAYGEVFFKNMNV